MSGISYLETLPSTLIDTLPVLLVISAIIAAAIWLSTSFSVKRKDRKRIAEMDAMTAEERRIAKWEAMNLEQRLAVRAEEDFKRQVRDGYYSESYLQVIDSQDRSRGLLLRARVRKAIAEMEAARNQVNESSHR